MTKIETAKIAAEVATLRSAIEALNDRLATMTAKPAAKAKAKPVAATIEPTISAGTVAALRAHVGRAKRLAIGTFGAERKAIMAIVAERQAKVDAALAGNTIVKTAKPRATKPEAAPVEASVPANVAPTSLAAYRAHLSRAKIAAENATTVADYKAAMAKVEEKAAFLARLTA